MLNVCKVERFVLTILKEDYYYYYYYDIDDFLMRRICTRISQFLYQSKV